MSEHLYKQAMNAIKLAVGKGAILDCDKSLIYAGVCSNTKRPFFHCFKKLTASTSGGFKYMQTEYEGQDIDKAADNYIILCGSLFASTQALNWLKAKAGEKTITSDTEGSAI